MWHFDDGDPMKASPVSGRFYTRKICQLDKPIRRDSCAETPSFGVAGFEVGKCLATDRVDKNIARLAVQRFVGPGKPATELFELSDIHKRSLARGQGACAAAYAKPAYSGAKNQARAIKPSTTS